MMQDNYRDIFNEQAVDVEPTMNDAAFFSSSPGFSVMNKLALAGDNLSGVHTAKTIVSTQNSERQKKDSDLAASVAQQLLTAQQQFNESMQSARASIVDFEDTLIQAQAELDAQKAELDEVTITLADGSKAYLNTDSNNFTQQDLNGNWQVLDDDQQAEAHAYWQASGVSATQQDKMKLDSRQDNINSNSNFIAQSKTELTDVQQSIDSGIMKSIDGVEVIDTKQAEIEQVYDDFKSADSKYSTSITPQSYLSQGAGNELDSLPAPAHNTIVMSDSPPFSWVDNISEEFSSAADGKPIEPDKPIPDNIPAPINVSNLSNGLQ